MAIGIDRLGTTSVGSSSYDPGRRAHTFKKITLPAGQSIVGITAHISNGFQGPISIMIYSDTSGSPDKLIAVTFHREDNLSMIRLLGKRWVRFPANYYSAAGEDVWISYFTGNRSGASERMNISYETTGGADKSKVTGEEYISDIVSPVSRVFDYSMYATAIDVPVSELGTTSVGASTLVIDDNDYVFKKITLAAGKKITGIVMHMSTNASGSGMPLLYSDDSGPDKLIAFSYLAPNDNNTYLLATARWVTFNVNYYSEFGEDVWIAIYGGNDSTGLKVSYETTGGADRTTTGLILANVADSPISSVQTYDISLYANVI